MNRIPEGDDWKAHAIPCLNCEEPVLDEYEHLVAATRIDPAWWRCDAAATEAYLKGIEEETK